MHKAFRPIKGDLSKHTTDFSSLRANLHSEKTLCTKSTKILVLLTMAQGSTRFEHLEKSTDDYIIEQQNKNTRAKTTRDHLMWSYSLNFWEKNTSKEILKTSKPRNWTKISASLSLAWSEKTAKSLNLQVLEVCFQVLIDVWKNVNIPSVSSKTLLLNVQENAFKLTYRFSQG